MRHHPLSPSTSFSKNSPAVDTRMKRTAQANSERNLLHRLALADQKDSLPHQGPVLAHQPNTMNIQEDQLEKYHPNHAVHFQDDQDSAHHSISRRSSNADSENEKHHHHHSISRRSSSEESDNEKHLLHQRHHVKCAAINFW